MLLVEESSQIGLFKHLSDNDFGVRNIANKKAVKVIFFFQNIQNLMYILKKQQKIRKSFFFLRYLHPNLYR